MVSNESKMIERRDCNIMGDIPSTPKTVDLRENIADPSSHELIDKMKQYSEEGLERKCMKYGPDSISEGT